MIMQNTFNHNTYMVLVLTNRSINSFLFMTVPQMSHIFTVKNPNLF